jgi:hypothetical protein
MKCSQFYFEIKERACGRVFMPLFFIQKEKGMNCGCSGSSKHCKKRTSILLEQLHSMLNMCPDEEK